MLFRSFSQSNDDKKSDGVCFFAFFEKNKVGEIPTLSVNVVCTAASDVTSER